MCEIYDGPCGKIFWDTLLVLAGSLSCSGIRGDLQILVVLVIYRLVGLTALVGKMSGRQAHSDWSGLFSVVVILGIYRLGPSRSS